MSAMLIEAQALRMQGVCAGNREIPRVPMADGHFGTVDAVRARSYRAGACSNTVGQERANVFVDAPSCSDLVVSVFRKREGNSLVGNFQNDQAIDTEVPSRNLRSAADIEIRPASRAIGAEVVGWDLSQPVNDRDIAAFRQALAENCFLLFRDQDLTPEQQVSFSKRFGELEHHVLNDYLLAELPEIYVLSNVKKNGRAVGRAGAGQYWHTDMSYMTNPSFGSLLYAVEIPMTGGDTMFSNMYKAYDDLSAPLKTLFEGMRAVHDFAHTQRTYIAPAGLTKPASAEQLAKTPPIEQPLVRTHPETGRKSLYVSPGMMTGIVGLAPLESRALLQFLIEHTTRPEFVYRHQWRNGDLVFWDNWASMHCAINDYGPDDRRLMHRTTIKGRATA